MSDPKNADEPGHESKARKPRPKRPRKTPLEQSSLIEPIVDAGTFRDLPPPVFEIASSVSHGKAKAKPTAGSSPSIIDVADHGQHSDASDIRQGEGEALASSGIEELAEINVDTPPSAVSKPKPYLYLTNDKNLVEILTSGLIKTRDGYVKYRPDLLDASPTNSIPLFRDTVPINLLPSARAREIVRPVVIEIDRANVNVPEDAASLVIVQGPLALTNVSVLHFQNELDKREVYARAYAGIEFDWFELRVSPEIFVIDESLILNTTDTEQHSCERRISYAEADRIAGAASMLLSSAELFHDGVALALAENCLDLEILKAPQMSNLGDAWTTDSQDIFEAAFAALSTVESNVSWSPFKILETIAGSIKASRGDKDPNILLLRRLFLVVKNEADAISEDTNGQHAILALQWVLLHPNPVANIEKGLTLMDPISRGVATLFSGIINGFETLPTELRSRGVSRRVWSWQADRLRSSAATEASVPVPAGIQAEIGDDPRLAVARENGWSDCIVTTIEGDASKVEVSIDAGTLKIRIVGDVVQVLSLDVSRFERRNKELRSS